MSQTDGWTDKRTDNMRSQDRALYYCASHGKNRMVGCWHGYLSEAKCTFAYGQADVTHIHSLLLQQIQSDLTFLVPAHPDSPG